MADMHSQDYLLQVKQGLAADINTTATKNSAVTGEPHWVTDTGQLYIFDGTENLQIPTFDSNGEYSHGDFVVTDNGITVKTSSASETSPLTLQPSGYSARNIYNRSNTLTFGQSTGTSQRMFGMTYASASGSMNAYGASAEFYPSDSGGTAALGRTGNRWLGYFSDVHVGNRIINSKSVYTGTDTTDDVYSHICDSATAFTLTVTDGGSDGEEIRIKNRGVGTVTLSGKISTVTATTELIQGETIVLEWDTADDEWQ